mgnify:FL=1
MQVGAINSRGKIVAKERDRKGLTKKSGKNSNSNKNKRNKNLDNNNEQVSENQNESLAGERGNTNPFDFQDEAKQEEQMNKEAEEFVKSNVGKMPIVIDWYETQEPSEDEDSEEEEGGSDEGDDSVDEQNNEEAQEEAEEEAEEEEEKQEKEASKRAIINQFMKIKTIAPNRFYPHLKSKEKDVVKQMRKINPVQVMAFDNLMMVRKQQFWAKVKAILATPLGGFLIGIIIAFVALIAIVFVVMLFGGGEDGENLTGPMSSISDVTGESFYGARLVYSDDEQATLDILEDYVEVLLEVESAVELADSNLDITLTLPSTDFDYSTFDETTFMAEYSDAYEIILDLSTLVAENDLVEGETIGETLEENLALIKYFGYSSELTPEMANIISTYINENDLYVYSSEDGAVEVESLITTQTLNVLSAPKYNVRTEKLYVKDYILNGTETLSDIPQENYKYMIYMPKENVTFSYFSFTLREIDFDNFTLSLLINGELTELNGGLFTSSEDFGIESYNYETATDLSILASAFTDIDTENLNALSEESSLFDILSLENSDIYLTDFVDDTGTANANIKTIKTNGIGVQFISEQPFFFAEFGTALLD